MGERVGDDGLNADGLTVRLQFQAHNTGPTKRIWGRVPPSWTLGQLKRFSLAFADLRTAEEEAKKRYKHTTGDVQGRGGWPDTLDTIWKVRHESVFRTKSLDTSLSQLFEVEDLSKHTAYCDIHCYTRDPTFAGPTVESEIYTMRSWVSAAQNGRKWTGRNTCCFSVP